MLCSSDGRLLMLWRALECITYLITPCWTINTTAISRTWQMYHV